MVTSAHGVDVEIGTDGPASAPPSGAAALAPPAGAVVILLIIWSFLEVIFNITPLHFQALMQLLFFGGLMLPLGLLLLAFNRDKRCA
jgi:hypothetical protein